MKWKIDQMKKRTIHSIGLDGCNDQSKPPKDDNDQDQPAADQVQHAPVRVDVKQELPHLLPGEEIAGTTGRVSGRASDTSWRGSEFLKYQATADAFTVDSILFKTAFRACLLILFRILDVQIKFLVHPVITLLPVGPSLR